MSQTIQQLVWGHLARLPHALPPKSMRVACYETNCYINATILMDLFDPAAYGMGTGVSNGFFIHTFTCLSVYKKIIILISVNVWTHCPVDTASRVTSFLVIISNVIEILVSFDKLDKTRLGLHDGRYLGKLGLHLNTPFKNRQTQLFTQISLPNLSDNADLNVFNVLYLAPALNRLVSNISIETLEKFKLFCLQKIKP